MSYRVPMPKSLQLAQLLAGKYRDHLPLHRQIAIFARGDVHLKAFTVCDWVQGAAEWLESLSLSLRKRVSDCSVKHPEGHLPRLRTPQERKVRSCDSISRKEVKKIGGA